MSSGYFRFKLFTVCQRYSSFGVTTDSVLLGAWAGIESASTILDIGTGTGLLALMAAQRSAAQITAIEPDRNSYMQAGINFAASPWYERLTLYHSSLQQFMDTNEGRFDAIIVSPPYFVDSLINPDQGKAQARHAFSLGPEELASSAALLLAPEGKLHLVLPVSASMRVITLARQQGLNLQQRTLVRGKAGQPPKRALLTFGREATACQESEIVIEEGARHHYSDEYIALTKDFYLNF